MNKPLYAVLAAGYPRKPKYEGDKTGIDTASLYTSIGHPEYAHAFEMQNTCAVRVSMALLAAGIQPTPGHMTVLAGRYAGRRIEQSQKLLSAFLKQGLGQPEVYKNGYDAWKRIRPRHGIVSFFHLSGGNWDNQGHIDLVEPAEMDDLQCIGTCYWSSTEVWFWPLK